jgi:hypothetical protein
VEERAHEPGGANSRPNGGTSEKMPTLPVAAKGRAESERDRAMITPQEAATGILAALSEYDSAIEQLRTDSRRPSSRFNLHYQEEDPAAILPYLSVLKRLTEILQLRASAELALGRNEEAFTDVKLCSTSPTPCAEPT